MLDLIGHRLRVDVLAVISPLILPTCNVEADRKVPKPPLERRAINALGSLENGKALLAQALRQEDEYQGLVADLIRQNGGSDEIIRSYAEPSAFSGGAKASIELMLRLQLELLESARQANIEVPPLFIFLWPQRTPNAASSLGEGGGLIRIDVGMLIQLRLFMHLVCGSLSTITGDAAGWGEDGLSIEQARNEFLSMLDEYFKAPPVPLWQTVRVNSGAREEFRRQASWAALAYVAAHEIGHLVPENAEYKKSALTAKGEKWESQSFTEVQAVASPVLESRADDVAIRILRKWNPVHTDVWEFARVAGPMAVMAIQSSLFWLKVGRTNEQLDWRHPLPDLRIANLALGLANPAEYDRIGNPDLTPGEPIKSDLSKLADRFNSWLDEVTGASAFRHFALKRGLENRGLTPAQLAMIYTAYGVPTGTK